MRRTLLKWGMPLKWTETASEMVGTLSELNGTQSRWGGVHIKCGGDFIGIAKDPIKSAENSIRMGLRCSGIARAEGCGVRVVRTFTRFGLTPFYVGELVRFSWENNNFCNS